jgi:hypothetical protein
MRRDPCGGDRPFVAGAADQREGVDAARHLGAPGRDCEERFAYYRCLGAYEFSSEFYRAVFDRFFTPQAQQAL